MPCTIVVNHCLSFALHGYVCCSRHEYMAITVHSENYNGHARTDGYFIIESHYFLKIYIYSINTAFLGYLTATYTTNTV